MGASRLSYYYLFVLRSKHFSATCSRFQHGKLSPAGPMGANSMGQPKPPNQTNRQKLLLPSFLLHQVCFCLPPAPLLDMQGRRSHCWSEHVRLTWPSSQPRNDWVSWSRNSWLLAEPVLSPSMWVGWSWLRLG
jgi:hypothetical protein